MGNLIPNYNKEEVEEVGMGFKWMAIKIESNEMGAWMLVVVQASKKKISCTYWAHDGERWTSWEFLCKLITKCDNGPCMIVKIDVTHPFCIRHHINICLDVSISCIRSEVNHFFEQQILFDQTNFNNWKTLVANF
jgi:hypothetical protein